MQWRDLCCLSEITSLETRARLCTSDSHRPCTAEVFSTNSSIYISYLMSNCYLLLYLTTERKKRFISMIHSVLLVSCFCNVISEAPYQLLSLMLYSNCTLNNSLFYILYQVQFLIVNWKHLIQVVKNCEIFIGVVVI